MKRLERALEEYAAGYNNLASYIRKCGILGKAELLDFIEARAKEIDAILHPVEVEEVPVEMWARYKHGTLYDSGLTEEDAKRMASRDPDVYQAVKLQGTIRREKKVVERSVEIEVSKIGTVWLLDGEPAHEICGKTGTFEWTE